MRNTRTLSVIIVPLLAAFGVSCTDQPFTVDVPIRVVSISPSGEGAPRDTSIDVTFSEDVVESTVTNTNNLFLGKIDDQGNVVKVKGTITYDPEKFVASFKPDELLDYSALYQVTINTWVHRKRDNGPLPVIVTGTFRAIDPPPLQVVSTSPENGATGVSRTAPFVVTFSEGVKQAQIDTDGDGDWDQDDRDNGSMFLVTDADTGQPIDGSISFTVSEDLDPNDPDITGDDTVLTFMPTSQDFQRWAYSQLVKVTLKAALESDRATSRGGQLGADVTVQFRAEDPPAIKLVQASPGDGATDVPRDMALALTFSEGVRQAQIDTDGDGDWDQDDRDNGSMFLVTDADTGQPIDGSISFAAAQDLDPADPDITGDDTVLTFMPTSQDFQRWAYSQLVKVTSGTGE
ncbi:MAG: Ig-like domain-containing protein [Deltaproteobacteria bacterium]|nr:Ig-like domain-containing protein [Deltaproteobacteria bacterium]